MATLPASLQVVGEVHSEEDLVIEGRVQGNIHMAAGTLTIGEQARIDGDIRAIRIHVHGTVCGAISASERIEIAASASVTGSLSADHVVIIEGGLVNGHIDMNRRTIAARVARHQATGPGHAHANS
jgi:cytoskeletal protein CcmA (bactofilin family)